MKLVTDIIMMFSVLVPSKLWFTASQPVLVTVRADEPVDLILADFTGVLRDTSKPRQAAPGQQVDLRAIYEDLNTPGTYVLYAVPPGKALGQFLGTPLVIQVRADRRPGAPPGPMVIKVEPLRYAVMTTELGRLTMAFYYDSAPNTVSAILTLAEQGFYDGLSFHRIVPGFVIQGGDPRGDGTGGPGFRIEAEFNDRKHEEGVLSMARSGDPLESQGAEPRPEFANSAGSQFFICLARVAHLDRRYTAFGKVVDGMDTVRAIAKVPVADVRTGRPEKAPVIQKLEVRSVTQAENPYPAIMVNLRPGEPVPASYSAPATQPAARE